MILFAFLVFVNFSSYDKTTLQKKIKDVDYMRKWTYTAKALKETLERFKQQRRHGTDVAGVRCFENKGA